MEATAVSSPILVQADRCPFCSFDRVWLWDKGMPGRFAVCCSNPACAATGPMAESEAAAVLLWNKALRPIRRTKPNAAYEHATEEMHKPTTGG